MHIRHSARFLVKEQAEKHQGRKKLKIYIDGISKWANISLCLAKISLQLLKILTSKKFRNAEQCFLVEEKKCFLSFELIHFKSRTSFLATVPQFFDNHQLEFQNHPVR